MYAPGVLWTAAHHHIPLLSVMHNNRAYHQEVMHVQRMADRHSRGIDRATSAPRITDPEHRLRQGRAKAWALCRRADHRSQGSGPGDLARDRSREARRAGAGRRRHAAALRVARVRPALYIAILACCVLPGGAQENQTARADALRGRTARSCSCAPVACMPWHGRSWRSGSAACAEYAALRGVRDLGA